MTARGRNGGRKPTDNPLCTTVSFRLTAEEYAACEAAAKRSGIDKVAAWIRKVVIPLAQTQTAKEANQQRAEDGRYAHAPDAVCVCGHPKGVHLAGRHGGDHACIHGDFSPGESCDCDRFRIKRACG